MIIWIKIPILINKLKHGNPHLSKFVSKAPAFVRLRTIWCVYIVCLIVVLILGITDALLDCRLSKEAKMLLKVIAIGLLYHVIVTEVDLSV